MKTVDVTFQNLDSSEISLTDVSHYFDSDPTKLVAGLRDDGKTPAAFIADTTTANAQVGGAGGEGGWGEAVVCESAGSCTPGATGLTVPLTVPPAAPAALQVRSLGETVRLDARTKLLNPKWCACCPPARVVVNLPATGRGWQNSRRRRPAPPPTRNLCNLTVPLPPPRPPLSPPACVQVRGHAEQRVRGRARDPEAPDQHRGLVRHLGHG